MNTGKAYSQELVKVYDRSHFGGASGRFILEKDLLVVKSLLNPDRGLVLDIPCGTGVYSAEILDTGYEVVAGDASLSMLQVTGHRGLDIPRLLCDINRLPFKDDTFDGVVTLRLFSHFPACDVGRMLQELRRVIHPGGRLVFDTFRWTPRRWPLLRRFVEQSYIEVIPPAEVEELIVDAGLRKVKARYLYLFSPIWQRKLPLWLLRQISALEDRMPPHWLLRTFWACTKD